eukprot:2283411-Amphidinium_carterae.1
MPGSPRSCLANYCNFLVQCAAVALALLRSTFFDCVLLHCGSTPLNVPSFQAPTVLFCPLEHRLATTFVCVLIRSCRSRAALAL